jgi:outer membrane immunogenic protein
MSSKFAFIAAIAAVSPLVVSPAFAGGPAPWSGFYVGINGGYGWGDIDTSKNSITTTGALLGITPGAIASTTFGGADSSADVDGWLGGAQIGYNHRSGSLVVGLEADYQAADLDSSGSFLGSAAGPFYQTEAKLDSFGTVRARIGFTVNDFLLYGTGGVAFGQAKADLSVQGGVPGGFTGPKFSDSETETMVGFAIGGGAEWAIPHSAWTVKAEYLHADFGDKTFDFSFSGTSDTATTRGEVTVDVVRLGLNYGF